MKFWFQLFLLKRKTCKRKTRTTRVELSRGSEKEVKRRNEETIVILILVILKLY